MRIAEADILLVPGRSEPLPGHWQNLWCEKMANAEWVTPSDWGTPSLPARLDQLQSAIMMATRPVVLVAHSLGVFTAVHAAHRLADTKVRGAFLVAAPHLPADLDELEADIRPFAAISTDPLPFPTMLVASGSDPYCSLEEAASFAVQWGSDFHNAGDAGHIDTASGHGPWPEGLVMFTRLMQRLKA